MTDTNCNYCNYCDYCNYCNYCNYCDYCNYCNYCKNLKMTEYNYFCWSEKYNDENAFQQKRYRVFNVKVTEEEYNKIDKIYHKLEFDNDESYATRFQTAFKKMWDTLSQKEKQEYFDIPHFDKIGFEFIVGVKVDEPDDDIISLNGKKYSLIKD